MASLHRPSGKAVARLPPELLGDIAAFLDQRHGNDDIEWRTQSVFRDLCNSAATCRAWRGPFSRQLMQELHVTSEGWIPLKTRDLSLARRYPIRRLHVSLGWQKPMAKFFFDLLSLTRSSVKTLCVAQDELVLDPFAIKHDLQNLEELELIGVGFCRLERFGYIRGVLPKLTFLKCRDVRFRPLSLFSRYVSTPALVKVEFIYRYDEHDDLTAPWVHSIRKLELLTDKGLRMNEISLILENDYFDASSHVIVLFVEGLPACVRLRIFRLSVKFNAAVRGRGGRPQELNIIQPLMAAIPSCAPLHTLCIDFSIYAEQGFEVCLVALLRSLQTSELPRLVNVQVWFFIYNVDLEIRGVRWSKTEIESQLAESTWDELKSWCDKQDVTINLRVRGSFD